MYGGKDTPEVFAIHSVSHVTQLRYHSAKVRYTMLKRVLRSTEGGSRVDDMTIFGPVDRES